jgi:hypothetical protein
MVEEAVLEKAREGDLKAAELWAKYFRTEAASGDSGANYEMLAEMIKGD